jgi:hypothetical protein
MPWKLMGEGIAPPFLPSVVSGSVWSDSHHGCFYPGETAPGTHLIGGWVGRKAGLEVVEKGEIFFTRRGSNPGYPACVCTDWAIAAHSSMMLMYLFIILFVFNDLARSSAYVALSEGLDGERWVGEDVQGSCLDLIWFTISTFLAVTGVTGRDLKVVNQTGKIWNYVQTLSVWYHQCSPSKYSFTTTYILLIT